MIPSAQAAYDGEHYEYGMVALRSPPSAGTLQSSPIIAQGSKSMKDILLSQIKAAAKKNGESADKFLFASIEALISIYINRMPRGYSIFEDWDGLVRGRNPADYLFGYSSPPQALWAKLRWDLEDSRKILLKLPDFVARHYDVEKDIVRMALDRSISKLKKHIARVEMIEEAFRHQLAVIGAAKGVAAAGLSLKAAELSIQESKRTILGTCCFS